MVLIGLENRRQGKRRPGKMQLIRHSLYTTVVSSVFPETWGHEPCNVPYISFFAGIGGRNRKPQSLGTLT